jgi:enoyl-CoA hydratase
MAHEIARFPQACMRADRRSAYAQQGLTLREAMRKEWYNGFPAFEIDGAAGAARFASGKGRHGDFRDI